MPQCKRLVNIYGVTTSIKVRDDTKVMDRLLYLCPNVRDWSISMAYGTEADRHHKKIAILIALKRNEEYTDVISYIPTRLRFSVTTIMKVKDDTKVMDRLLYLCPNVRDWSIFMA